MTQHEFDTFKLNFMKSLQERFYNIQKPINQVFEEMRKNHQNPAHPVPALMVDVEALALFKEYSKYEIDSFYDKEQSKDNNEAASDFDKLTDIQHQIIKRALSFHKEYEGYLSFKRNLQYQSSGVNPLLKLQANKIPDPNGKVVS